MMSKSEYKPQFETNFQDYASKEEISVCTVCGEPSVSLHKGVCFKCRREESAEPTDERDRPNFDLFLEWRRSEALEYGFMFGRFLSLFKTFGLFTTILIFASSMLIASLIIFREMLTPVGFVLVGALCAVSVVFTVIRIVGNRKRVMRRFVRFNESVVVTGLDERWICPCCKTSNEYVQHCTTCGVKPHILTVTENGQKTF